MSNIRLFIAAEMPGGLVEYFAGLGVRFPAQSWRTVPEANLHLTLLFIGNVPVTRLTEIQEKLPRIARQHAAFRLELEKIEAGPKPKNPRLIWARFTRHPSFENLSRHLHQELVPEVGLPADSIPHVTLARRRKEASQLNPFPEITPANRLTLPVSRVGIWQSELRQPHPVYSVLHSYPLLAAPLA